MLYAWVWMPLVALTSVSPLAPYSKRQTEGHFVERLRTGLVIQHGPERPGTGASSARSALPQPARTLPGGRRRLELSTPSRSRSGRWKAVTHLRNYPEDASRDAADKLRLGGTPTPRSLGGSDDEAACIDRCGQERLPKGRSAVETARQR